MIIYTGIQEIETSIVAYSQGSWVDIFWQRLDDWLYMTQYGAILIIDFIYHRSVFINRSCSSKLKLIERATRVKSILDRDNFITLAAGL